MSEINHFIRFGSHAEAKIFREVKSSLKGITFNANVIAHTPAAIYKFLYIGFPDIPFFIDPQTYIYQLDPIKYYSNRKEDGLVLKSSVDSLLDLFGEPVTSVRNTMRPLNHSVFETCDIDGFVERVIGFQINHLNDEYQKTKSDEGYDDYDDNGLAVLKPLFVIPPYFYLNSDPDFENWLELNIKMIESSFKHFPDREIVPEIVIDRNVLKSKSLVSSIISAYNRLDINNVLIWIDNFDETDEDLFSLTKLREFLSSFNADPINLYGGGFSNLLCKQKILSGFCHGPGYGESRGVKPVGGGIPNAKYYLPFLMKRINYEDAYRLLKTKGVLNEDYFEKVCNCVKCNELLKPPIEQSFYNEFGLYKLSSSGKINVPTQNTLFNNHVHFLNRRFYEINDMTIEKIDQYFVDFLEWNATKRMISTQHIENWRNIINGDE